MTLRPRGLSETTSVFQGVDATPGPIRKGCQPWEVTEPLGHLHESFPDTLPTCTGPHM